MKTKIIPHYFENDGIIPNNKLPVLIYKNALKYTEAIDFEFCFNQNGWSNNWTDIILPYDHFHSNTHEVLGLKSGHAQLMLGGKNGKIIQVDAGDVLIIPAGVGHHSIDNSLDYQFVGGYPNAADWNLKIRLIDEDCASIIEEIAQIPIPATDPVYGVDGPLFAYWK
jgi:uncharacterized protein YjlB